MQYLPILDQILPQYTNSLDSVAPILPTRQALGSFWSSCDAIPYCREIANEKWPVNSQFLCFTSVFQRFS